VAPTQWQPKAHAALNVPRRTVGPRQLGTLHLVPSVIAVAGVATERSHADEVVAHFLPFAVETSPRSSRIMSRSGTTTPSSRADRSWATSSRICPFSSKTAFS